MPSTLDRYPLDPNDPASRQESRITELERQVAQLQGAQGIRSTTMTDGVLRITDEGNEVARVGLGGFSGPGGVKSRRRGVFINSSTGGRRFIVTAEDGLVWPPARVSWDPLSTPVGNVIAVTAGAFTPTHRVVFTMAADSLRARITIGADAATTGELRLESGGPHQTAVVPLPAGTLAEYRFDWLLGPDGVGIALGVDLSVDIQVRRTGGAGNINVHGPAPILITDRVILDSSVNGL